MADLKIDEIMSSWETYFNERVKKRRDVTDLYLKYARDLLEKGMPPIFDLQHLARLVGIEPSKLAALIANPDQHYRSFELQKRGGGKRLIDVPCPTLLSVQRWIKSNILDGIRIHDAAHGFVNKRSVVTNANVHLGGKFLLKVDLKDFFPSIGIRRAIAVFLRSGFPPKIAYFLSALCCKGGLLPQGAATSPSLSNIVAKRLDARLSGVAEKRGLRYSRYADDMVFSGEVLDAGLLGVVDEIVRREGFQLNARKTQFVKERSKKIITGVSISAGKPRLPRKAVRDIKQQSHFILRRGYWAHIEATGNRDPVLIERLIGRVGFWLQIDPDNKTALRLRDELAHVALDAYDEDKTAF